MRKDERWDAYEAWAAREAQKEGRRRRIQRARFLGLLRSYANKPIPSVWYWLRNPAV